MLLTEREAAFKKCWLSDWVHGYHNCEGSACMAWIWIDDGMTVGENKHGFCGPAGQPLEKDIANV